MPILVGAIGLLTAIFEYKKLKQANESFRQNLIFLLHHSEGITSSIRSIRWQKYSTVDDVKSALDSAYQNSEALFFGLIESKVGGVALKNDLDKKYSEWADLALEYKKLPLKNWLEGKKEPVKDLGVENISLKPNSDSIESETRDGKRINNL